MYGELSIVRVGKQEGSSVFHSISAQTSAALRGTRLHRPKKQIRKRTPAFDRLVKGMFLL